VRQPKTSINTVPVLWKILPKLVQTNPLVWSQGSKRWEGAGVPTWTPAPVVVVPMLATQLLLYIANRPADFYRAMH